MSAQPYDKDSDERELVKGLCDGIRQYGRDARYAVPYIVKAWKFDRVPNMNEEFKVEFAVPMLLGHVGPMLATLDTLRAQLDAARKALGFYADEKNWTDWAFVNGTIIQSSVNKDNGATARTILKGGAA